MWWEKQGLWSQEDPGHNLSSTLQESYNLHGRAVLKYVRGKNNTSSEFKVFLKVPPGRLTQPVFLP